MLIKALFTALVIGSIFAGVLSAASEGWPPNPPSDSGHFQSRIEIISPSF
jgi:hypothetical protein